VGIAEGKGVVEGTGVGVAAGVAVAVIVGVCVAISGFDPGAVDGWITSCGDAEQAARNRIVRSTVTLVCTRKLYRQAGN
jgi:hypothetical protein